MPVIPIYLHDILGATLQIALVNIFSSARGNLNRMVKQVISLGVCLVPDRMQPRLLVLLSWLQHAAPNSPRHVLSLSVARCSDKENKMNYDHINRNF
jgi:hypothetical protein